jgi:hypothetical protein
MNNKKLRLIIGILLLLLGIGMIIFAALTSYEAYSKPDPRDFRKVDKKYATTLKHFDMIEAASVDGLTRYPAPQELAAGNDWVLVEKARQAACVS